MRLTISKAEMVRLLAATTKVVEARNTIPILSMVRLVADGGKLVVTATDLDITISASAACDIAADGEICVDAKLITSIVNKAPGELALTLEGPTLGVVSGRSRFKLPTLPTSDFPDFKAGTYTTEFEADLAALMAPCQFAMSTEETRFYLNGVYLHTQDGTMRAVATDGHRLSRNVAPLDVDMPGIIIPRKAVTMLPKGVVSVSVSDTKIRVVKDDFVLVSKLIDGTFPDYQRVIPTGNDKLVRVDNTALKAAADRVATISSERGRAVKLTITAGNIDLAVRGDGEALDAVQTDYAGDDVEIGFNAAYLVECLANLPAGDVTIALADGGAPALLSAGDNLLIVLMPMRI